MNSPSRLVSYRAIAGMFIVTALAVGGLLLVRGNGSSSPEPVPAPAPTTTVTARPATSTTTTPTSRPTPAHGVTVPNVVGLTRPAALVALADAGFQTHVTSLALAGVPGGFVVSQSPLPESLFPKGSTVALVVSATS
jgi:hypothetical protein